MVIAALGTLGIYVLQDRMIYHPHGYKKNAEIISTRPIIRVLYRTNQGKQIAFYAKPQNSDIPLHLWLIFGGNGATVLQYHTLIEQPALAETGLLLIDYPGYGYNQGKPSASAIQNSIDIAVATLADQLHLSVDDLLSRTNVLGHSFGTGVGLEFAEAHPEVQRIILVAPFTSLYDMAFRTVGPIAVLLHHNFDNEDALKRLELRTPRPNVEIFTGTRDQIIPVTMSRTLKAQNPWVTYVEKPNAEHMHIVTDEAAELANIMRDQQ